MGRTVKRVPLDFKWPIGMVWKGYVNPFNAQDCKACDHSGYNKETKEISDSFYDSWHDQITQDEVDALIAAHRLWDFTRTFVDGKWVDIEPKPQVTAAQVNAAQQAGSFRGRHDCINRFILIETRAKRLGVWGMCPFCGGEGHIFATPEIKRLYDEWEDFDPPSGLGWQVWETTSEGSPITPVFANKEELAKFCAGTSISVFGYSTWTEAEWLEWFTNYEKKVATGE